MRVLGIAGSLRRESFNRKLMAQALGIAGGSGAEVASHDLIDLPLYNQDVEDKGMPETVRAFREEIEKADAVIIATPEYNNSMSGVLKNAIDWGSRPPNRWGGKIACVMGATPGGFGTVQAQRDLRHVLTILDVMIVPYPFVYLSKAHEAFAKDGTLTNEPVAKNLELLVKRLLQVTRTLKG